MKSVFWTSVFWLLIVAGGLFYIKAYDTTLGTQVAQWLVSAEQASGAQSDLMSGVQMMQTNLQDLTTKLDLISAKLGISEEATGTVFTGTVVEQALTGAKK